LIERLHALRTGRVEPVQGKTAFVVQQLAWDSQHSLGYVRTLNQPAQNGTLHPRRSESSDRKNNDCGVDDEFAATAKRH
jgi:hypothetical protein